MMLKELYSTLTGLVHETSRVIKIGNFNHMNLKKIVVHANH
jgi:hypothetical protein